MLDSRIFRAAVEISRFFAFHFGTGVAGLTQILSSIQPVKIEK